MLTEFFNLFKSTYNIHRIYMNFIYSVGWILIGFVHKPHLISCILARLKQCGLVITNFLITNPNWSLFWNQLF